MLKQKIYKDKSDLFQNIINKDWIDDYFELSNFKLNTPKVLKIPSLEFKITDNFIKQQLLVFSLKLRSKLRELVSESSNFNNFINKEVFKNKIYLNLLSKIEFDLRQNIDKAITIKLKSELIDYWKDFWVVIVEILFKKYQKKIEDKIIEEIKLKNTIISKYISTEKNDMFFMPQIIYNKFELDFGFVFSLYRKLEEDIVEAWNSIYKISQAYLYVKNEGAKNE